MGVCNTPLRCFFIVSTPIRNLCRYLCLKWVAVAVVVNKKFFCKFQIIILYAGSGSTGLERAVFMDDGDNNTIRHSVIAHTAGGTNQTYAALDMSHCPQSCVAQNNTFFDNGHPVIISIANDFDDSNVFHNPANTATTNACNGIFVDCADHNQAQHITWTATEVAFVFGGWSGNSWAMGTGTLLTLGNNVVLKFNTHTPTPGFSLLVPDGASNIENYNGTGVAFTAYNDDALKGDTNGDGPSTGTAGYWDGIHQGSIWLNWSNMFYHQQ